MKGRDCWLSGLVGYGLKGYGLKGDFFLLSCFVVLHNHNFILLTFQIIAFKIGSFKITKA